MAKSLRSKWKRKMRAAKRERYGEKELKMLTDMLENFSPKSEVKKEDAENEMAVEGAEIDNECIITKSIEKNQRRISVPTKRRSRLNRETTTIPATVTEDESDKMAVDPVERIFSKRTMRDQFGSYPAWMSKKKVRTQQKKNKRLKKKAMKLKKI